MENKKLPIPVNVVEQEDIISGFGNKELFITGISVVLGVVLSVFIYVTSKNMIAAIGMGASVIAVTITMIRRDRYDESFLDKIRFVRLYRKAQKKFIYQYHNIYEGEMKKNDR